MFSQALRFVRLPLLMLVIYAAARFTLGLAGVPYAPRGNAMFSVVGLTVISGIYFGAVSGKVGGFNWKGTVLIGVLLGLFAQVLVLLATWISYIGHLETYYIHWDALNVPEGTVPPMAQAMAARAGGLIAGPITGLLAVLIGRGLSFLAPSPSNRAVS
ncbi:MAG: hypothetical protein AB1898_28260 [Acidobacteriota bacterium]